MVIFQKGGICGLFEIIARGLILLPWKPIKINDLDEIHMVGIRQLMKFCQISAVTCK